VLRIARHVHQRTGMKNLVLAGGVALNCVANGRLLREGPFEDIWIQPAAGDAGGALGAATFVWHQLLQHSRQPESHDSQQGSLLGPSFSETEIREFLDTVNTDYQHFSDEAALLQRVTQLLIDQKIVGWFQGPMEFGPRALGNRSILGDPRSPQMQSRMNLKIKYRESFRPFAPIVLQEAASDWFDIQPHRHSPYMLIVADLLPRHRLPLDEHQQRTLNESPDLSQRVNIPRSTVPAITHVDYSARLQTVDNTRNPRLHRLLSTFYQHTGCPMLVNTSFNVRGEPIVCTPTDAWRCFLATELDALVLGNHVILKTAPPNTRHFPPD
jgi:carbamoyltransferase